MTAVRGVSALKAFATLALADRLTRTALAALGDADVIPIKGILFARTLYADPTERPLSDVDLVLVRPGMIAGLRRLTAAGFAIRSWSADLHVELTHTRAPGLSLDLHRAPLSRGFGAMNARWLAGGARDDTVLFGTRVLLPSPERLLAITLGSIVRDHVFRAPEHAARDADALLRQATLRTITAAETLRGARFRRGAWVALQWVRRRAPSAVLDDLSDRLELTLMERLACVRALDAFERWSLARAAPRTSTMLSQCLSDDVRDGVMGIASTVMGLPVGALHRRVAERRSKR